jgi:hypothetical protein
MLCRFMKKSKLSDLTNPTTRPQPQPSSAPAERPFEPAPLISGACGGSKACVGGRSARALQFLFILALVLASFRSALGDPMQADQARTVVSGWFKAEHSPLETTLGQQVNRVETFNDAQGAPLYHVVYLNPDGFVIVAADDLVEPVIAFASSGRFDPSTNNPLGALVSRDLPGRIVGARGAQAAVVEGAHLTARNKWNRLESIEQAASGVETGISSVSDVRVSPLTQTTWDQTTAGGNACYNYYTPPNSEGSTANYYCGCVATAMSQLMRFWQYPINGVGTTSFTITVGGVSQSRSLRGGDGAGGAYVWANMVLSPGSSTTLAQRQAIGALCADAGVSVNMDYESGGSGTDTLLAKTAFVSTFGYANAIKGYNSGSTIGAGLNGMVNPNLDAGCPVLFGITDGSSGHAIVCDGYGYSSSTLYHHLNLGWSGAYSLWYNLPTIDAGYAFNSVYKCVYNVWTNGTGEIISGRITDNSGAALTGVVVTAVRSGGGTYTVTNDSHGIYAFARIPSSSTYTVSAAKTGYVFLSKSATTGLSSDYSATSGNQWAVDFAPADDLIITPATNVVSTGVVGGPFTPSSQTYVLTNTGASSLNWAASKTSSWVNLSATSGTLASKGSTSVTATFNAGSLTAGSYSDAITFSNRTSGSGNMTRQVTLTVVPPRIYSFALDTDPGWTRQGEWAFGHPTGSGGSSGGGYGNADPANGYTGTNVFGVNLSGNYSTTVGGPYYLIAGPLSFKGYTNVTLQFQRWLNSDYQSYVYATVDVSSNGSTWTSLFSNGSSSAIADSAWTSFQYDISTTAANQSAVYVRWGYQIGSGAYAYSGWNIDDVVFQGLPPHVPALSIALSGTNLTVRCTNGTPTGTYYLLASTNLTTPLTNWTVVATNSFDGSGCSGFTNGLGTNAPQRFFRIRLP